MSFLSVLSPAKLFSNVRASIKKVNWQFWIGNLVVVLSTVLGVYLAAHAALETAIKYEAIKTDRDNYYMRTSLYNEISHNIGALEKIISNLREGRRYRTQDQYIIHPQYFVWESLKSSRSALTTPSNILAGINEFYGNTQIVLNKVSERKDFKITFSANDLENQVKKLKESTLPLLENHLENLKEELIANEIELE